MINQGNSMISQPNKIQHAIEVLQDLLDCSIEANNHKLQEDCNSMISTLQVEIDFKLEGN